MRWVAAALLGLGFMAPVEAEQVAKKFRISFSAGIFDTKDSVPSDAANVLLLGDERQVLAARFRDPRNDSTVFGSLGIEPAPLAVVAAQYAVNNIFILEASVGYQKGDVGDIDLQVQFDGATVSTELPFNFTPFRIRAGDLTRIPLQLTAMARFRPRATFNPYFGAGVGYSIIGFEPSDEFNELSVNLDGAVGGQTRLTEELGSVVSELVQPPPDQFVDLDGARVDARDTFEFHAVGGAELSIRKGWALFVDLRYTVASRSLSIGFNGGEDLGISVPQLVDFIDSPVAFQSFGAMRIEDGGLVDGGRLVLQPIPTAPKGTDCTLSSQFCRLTFDPTQPDGQLDPGMYYIQGGTVDYDGLAMQFGVRVTF